MIFLVRSSASLSISSLVIFACFGSTFSLRCSSCLAPSCNDHKAQSVDCDGMCYTERYRGKEVLKRCAPLEEAEHAALHAKNDATSSDTTSIKNRYENGRETCYCSVKDFCDCSVAIADIVMSKLWTKWAEIRSTVASKWTDTEASSMISNVGTKWADTKSAIFSKWVKIKSSTMQLGNDLSEVKSSTISKLATRLDEIESTLIPKLSTKWNVIKTSIMSKLMTMTISKVPTPSSGHTKCSTCSGNCDPNAHYETGDYDGLCYAEKSGGKLVKKKCAPCNEAEEDAGLYLSSGKETRDAKETCHCNIKDFCNCGRASV